MVPLRLVGLLVGLEGGARPRSYRGKGGGGYATYFLRAYAGEPVAQTLRLSLLRCGERLYDTLRALPENVATPYAYWSKRAVLSTLRWRDNTAPFAVCFSLPLSLQPM